MRKEDGDQVYVVAVQKLHIVCVAIQAGLGTGPIAVDTIGLRDGPYLGLRDGLEVWDVVQGMEVVKSDESYAQCLHDEPLQVPGRRLRYP